MSVDAIKRIDDQMRDPASVRLWNALLPLKSVISFMNTGAHPDDETSDMLAFLGRNMGFRLSHACSTRGEGGQNALGTEVTEDLGMVRTREMERAARVLDMVQYWLSATPEDTIFDFGFSKSGKETLGNWDHQRTLDRFVRILRQERPDIVCPTFLDVPGQHGHHRAMTQAAHEAVVLAADPSAFPQHFDDGLDVWQVKKLYLPAWSGAGDAYDDDLPPPPETVRIDGSGYDPVLGASYAQIGQWSRAFHKTQEMGRWVEDGAETMFPLHLAWTPDGENGAEGSICDGLPADLAALAGWADAPEIRKSLKKAAKHMAKAFAAWPDNHAVGRRAAKALKHVKKAIAHCPKHAENEVVHRLNHKVQQLSRVMFVASGLSVRALAAPNAVAAGETADISVSLHDYLKLIDGPVEVMLSVPGGWEISDQGEGVFALSVPRDAALFDPYPDTFDPMGGNGDVQLRLVFAIDGVEAFVDVDLEAPLIVLPPVEVEIEPAAVIYNASAPADIVTRLSHSDQGLEVGAPEGWAVHIEGNTCRVVPADDVAPALFSLPLMVAGTQAMTVRRASYAHTGPVVRAVPTALDVRVIDAQLPQARVGYIAGGSDRVGYWLRALGVEVTDIDDKTLAAGDFSAFDSIVVGIFAFRTRPALAAQLSAVHNWVETGGNLVTLYHRPWDNWDPSGTAPGFLEIGKPSLRWRVTDQNAVVTYLDPDHALLNAPNNIGPDDWAGWHKERGLYFAAKWDDAYTPLLSMADPDEDPHQGSLLSGRFGAGRHTHTSLILHHQMEKLVPGAFRLMANLLAPPTQT